MNPNLFPAGAHYESAPITELRSLRLEKIAARIEEKPALVEAIATHMWNKYTDLARSFPSFGAFQAYCRAIAHRNAPAAARALHQMHEKRIDDALAACPIQHDNAAVDAVADEAWSAFSCVRQEYRDLVAFRAVCRARVRALARQRTDKTLH